MEIDIFEKNMKKGQKFCHFNDLGTRPVKPLTRALLYSKKYQAGEDKNQNETDDDKDNQKLLCNICNESFSNNSILEEHISDCFENCTMYDF